jgi:hypothetical protein
MKKARSRRKNGAISFKLNIINWVNGSGFLNNHLLRPFTEEKSPSNLPSAVIIIKTIM